MACYFDICCAVNYNIFGPDYWGNVRDSFYDFLKQGDGTVFGLLDPTSWAPGKLKELAVRYSVDGIEYEANARES